MDETDWIATECWKGAQQRRGQISITVIKHRDGGAWYADTIHLFR